VERKWLIMFPSSTRRFLKEINMSNEEISTVAEKIVEAVNKTTNNYDAKEKVSEILKEQRG
tara:strand:+ start:31 stop:213 length:183 start_codon:yes stop_codon:yes gene_type:complete